MTPPSFPILSSILRASDKLEFAEYRKWTKQIITTIWDPKLMNVTAKILPYAMEAVNLSTEYRLPVILKRALYELVRESNFGTTDLRDQKDAGCTLSLADTFILLKARVELEKEWFEATTELFRDGGCPYDEMKRPKNKCLYSAHKTDIATDAHRDTVDLCFVQKWLYDPICGCDALLELWSEWDRKHKKNEDACCDLCQLWRIGVIKKTKGKIWSGLNKWFDLKKQVRN